MNQDQKLGGGDFIVPIKEKNEKLEVESTSFYNQMQEIRKDLTVEEHRASVDTLQDKMTQERFLHRKLIDEIIEERTAESCDCTIVPENPPFDLLAIDHDAIKEKIRSLTNSMEGERKPVNENIDLDQIKNNLEMYRLEISAVKRKEIVNHKRNATIKMLKEHLDFIEKKCDHEMMKLENMQQDIRQLELRDDMDAPHLEMLYRTESANFQSSSNTPSYNFSDSIEHEYLTNETLN